MWHSSLTKKNVCDLERVQKAAIWVILKDKYQNYGDALSALKLKSLRDRRDKLCLKFAKNCLKVEKFKKLFLINNKEHCMTMRSTDKFEVETCGSNRYRDSALPYVKRLLNRYQLDKNQLSKALNVPMNYGKYAPRYIIEIIIHKIK